MSCAGTRFLCKRSAGAAIARPREIGVKTPQRWEKAVVLPLLNAIARALANRIFGERNGDRSMTLGVVSAIVTGGISASRRMTTRQPRFSLGSSHALLLLSSP
jgi:hypothetical protein